MHMADALISPAVGGVMWATTAGTIAYCSNKVRKEIDDKKIPLMGVLGAFIFAAQMINFPVAGGTSGHLMGGVLAAVLLGPWAGTLVMACVIAVQGLVFSDGGLLVMGANIFNMGIVGTLGGFAIYRALCSLLGGEDRGRIPASAIAGWLSVVIAAAFIAGELAVSGTSPAEFVFPAMLTVHAAIGVGEAIITAATLAFIGKVRPDLFNLRGDRAARPSGSASPVPA